MGKLVQSMADRENGQDDMSEEVLCVDQLCKQSFAAVSISTLASKGRGTRYSKEKEAVLTEMDVGPVPISEEAKDYYVSF
eukprot:1462343-Heterocapsa_arctica.AAC.1